MKKSHYVSLRLYRNRPYTLIVRFDIPPNIVFETLRKKLYSVIKNFPQREEDYIGDYVMTICGKAAAGLGGTFELIDNNEEILLPKEEWECDENRYLYY